MRDRPIATFRPGLERFEDRKLLSAAAATSHAEGAGASGRHAAETSRAVEAAAAGRGTTAAPRAALPTEFLAYRITNPTPFNVNSLVPPFQQVYVQSQQPVPGQVYNILFVSVRNGTGQTFTASNNFQVRLQGGSENPVGQPSFPILTGDQTWKPGQVLVFYVLTKKYYPVAQVAGGFQLDLGGRSSTLVPGPSGVFLRMTYNPATFANALNQIVAFGQGNQGGQGAHFGLPNTSINEIVSANTDRKDFAGHF
jgi:hypothetical protein